MDKTMKKAIEHIKKSINVLDLEMALHTANKQKEPLSYIDEELADDIYDALEEYGDDNDLPEGWWMEYGEIEDIAELIIEQ